VPVVGEVAEVVDVKVERARLRARPSRETSSTEKNSGKIVTMSTRTVSA
jgi:hypothetical protein